jgi:hypothetical protein
MISSRQLRFSFAAVIGEQSCGQAKRMVVPPEARPFVRGFLPGLHLDRRLAYNLQCRNCEKTSAIPSDSSLCDRH